MTIISRGNSKSDPKITFKVVTGINNNKYLVIYRHDLF